MLETQKLTNQYEELCVPYVIKGEALESTGHLPKFERVLFRIAAANKFLIPTSEVILVNHCLDMKNSGGKSPIKLTSCTPCFRNEPEAHGKMNKGLLRQHQFDKVELVQICQCLSYRNQNNLVRDAGAVIKNLNLHYRITEQSTQDISFTSTKSFDVEVWFKSLGMYIEVSSCSNTEEFQYRKLHQTFTPSKPSQFLHILNGSGTAIGRVIAAIIENNQTKNGDVELPKVLMTWKVDRVV